MENCFDIESCGKKDQILKKLDFMYSPYRMENFSEALWNLRPYQYANLIESLEKLDWERAGKLLQDYVTTYMMKVAYEDILEEEQNGEDEDEEDDYEYDDGDEKG